MPRLDWSEGEEKSLVEAAQLGDLGAFDQLARRYRPIGLVLARRLLEKEQAEDAVQDSLLSAYKALPHLRVPEAFAGWFAAIVRRRSAKALTTPERNEERLSDHVDRLIVKWAPSIASHHEERESDAHEAVDKLPDQLRAVAELYYLQDCSVQVISEVLGLTVTTVKWRLHQARQFLRRRCLFEPENS
jgi:RNA polymerase sigma-70 factor (ECF subfamily)